MSDEQVNALRADLYQIAVEAGDQGKYEHCNRCGLPLGSRYCTCGQPYRSGHADLEPRFAGLAEAAKILGVSKQRVNQLAQRDGFPRPLLRLKATPIWSIDDLESYAKTRRSAVSP